MPGRSCACCAFATLWLIVGCSEASDDTGRSVEDAGLVLDGSFDASSSEAGTLPQVRIPDGSAIDATDGAETGPHCSARACWCEQFCRRIEQLECANDPPYESCIDRCVQLTELDCASEDLATVVCRVQLPDEAYRCDSLRMTNMQVGCRDEVEAYRGCLEAAEDRRDE